MERKFSDQATFLAYVTINVPENYLSLVTSTLWQLYQLSDQIASAFEAMTNIGLIFSQKLTINYGVGAFSSEVDYSLVGVGLRENEHVVGIPGYVVTVDPDADQLDGWHVAEDGSLVHQSFARALGHELWHALSGQSDPKASYINQNFPNNQTPIYPAFPQAARDWLGDPSADFQGDTVVAENAIGLALGGDNSWKRISYFSGLPEEFGATNGRLIDVDKIDRVFSDFPSPAGAEKDTIDFHRLSGASLVLGHGGRDEVLGSQGSDYLYGGLNNDVFFGNQGSDFTHGGDLFRLHEFDGFDIADYSKWNSFTAKNTGTINAVLAPGQAMEFGATATADVFRVTKSQGGIDRLVSIEKIIGTDGNDQATVTSGMKIENSLTLDFGGGINTLTYNGSGPTQLNGPLQYLYHTKLEDGTPTGRGAAYQHWAINDGVTW